MKSVLAYYNQTFMRLSVLKQGLSEQRREDLSGLSERTQEILKSSMLYDNESKAWGNPYKASERLQLEFIKNKNEFLERKWILLRKSAHPESGKYVQEGPYSAQEIFELLESSQIKFTDGIWKNGFSKWTPIKDTLTFKELTQQSETLEPDAAEILSHVMEYDPEMHRVEEKNPSPKASSEVFLILDDK